MNKYRVVYNDGGEIFSVAIFAGDEDEAAENFFLSLEDRSCEGVFIEKIQFIKRA